MFQIWSALAHIWKHERQKKKKNITSSTSLNSFYSFTVCTALRETTTLFFHRSFSPPVPLANTDSLPSLYLQLMPKMQRYYCLLTGYYTGTKKQKLSFSERRAFQFLTGIKKKCDLLKHFWDHIAGRAIHRTLLEYHVHQWYDSRAFSQCVPVLMIILICLLLQLFTDQYL